MQKHDGCARTGGYGPTVAVVACVLLQASEDLNHRIIGWKRPLRSSPTVNPAPPFLVNHVLKCHIYMFFNHLQGWWLNHLPRQPVPMSDHSFSKEIFPNIQSKPPLTQLEAIASHPIASYLGEEINTCLTTTSSTTTWQEVVVRQVLVSSPRQTCNISIYPSIFSPLFIIICAFLCYSEILEIFQDF